MSFGKVPDRMVGYATYELAELLARLTQPQRDAIDRIVQHVYIDNRPWAILFRDIPAQPPSFDNPLGRPAISKICSESNYYRRGRVDPETGRRLARPGWGHDEEFQAALKMAVELALAAGQRERLGWLQAAKRRAEQSAESAVDTWVEVMENSRVDFARIDAAGRVLDLAFKGSGDQSAGTKEEADWWAAAGSEKEGD